MVAKDSNQEKLAKELVEFLMPTLFAEKVAVVRNRLAKILSANIGRVDIGNLFKGGKGSAKGAINSMMQGAKDIYSLTTSDTANLLGGTPEDPKKQEMLSMRDDIDEMMVSNVFGKFNTTTNVWERDMVNIECVAKTPRKNITVTIKNPITGAIPLPKPLNSVVIPERVKGVKKSGEEISLKIKINKLGEVVLENDSSDFVKIVYTISQSKLPNKIEDVDASNYENYKRKFISKNKSSDLSSTINGLPQVFKIF